MSEKDVGHTLMIGATGSGKTIVLKTVLASLGITGNRASRRGQKTPNVRSGAKYIGKRVPGARP